MAIDSHEMGVRLWVLLGPSVARTVSCNPLIQLAIAFKVEACTKQDVCYIL